MALVAALATPSEAHFLWICTDHAHHRASFSIAESPGVDTVPMKMAPSKAGIKLESIGFGKIAPSSDGAGLVADLLKPAGGVRLPYGVFDNSLVTWWAKTAVDFDAAQKDLGQKFEVRASLVRGRVIVTVFGEGKPVAGCSVEVYGEGIPAQTTVTTDRYGRATVPKAKSGSESFGAQIVVNGSGTYKGSAYGKRLEMATLTVSVD